MQTAFLSVLFYYSDIVNSFIYFYTIKIKLLTLSTSSVRLHVMDFSSYLRQCAEKRNVSIAQIAHAMGILPQALTYKLRNNAWKTSDLPLIADALNCTYCVQFTGNDKIKSAYTGDMAAYIKKCCADVFGFDSAYALADKLGQSRANISFKLQRNSFSLKDLNKLAELFNAQLDIRFIGAL